MGWNWTVCKIKEFLRLKDKKVAKSTANKNFRKDVELNKQKLNGRIRETDKWTIRSCNDRKRQETLQQNATIMHRKIFLEVPTKWNRNRIITVCEKQVEAYFLFFLKFYYISCKTMIGYYWDPMDYRS